MFEFQTTHQNLKLVSCQLPRLDPVPIPVWMCFAGIIALVDAAHEKEKSLKWVHFTSVITAGREPVEFSFIRERDESTYRCKRGPRGGSITVEPTLRPTSILVVNSSIQRRLSNNSVNLSGYVFNVTFYPLVLSDSPRLSCLPRSSRTRGGVISRTISFSGPKGQSAGQ